jgi:hypothetical protein
MNAGSHLDAPEHSVTSRLYETEEDLLQMQALLMEARARTDDWRYAHVGELMWGFFMVVCHLNPFAVGALAPPDALKCALRTLSQLVLNTPLSNSGRRSHK